MAAIRKPSFEAETRIRTKYTKNAPGIYRALRVILCNLISTLLIQWIVLHKGIFMGGKPLKQPMMEQATTFSDFVLHTGYEDIPVDVIERAKDLILDLIGVSAAAHAIKASRLGRETAVRLFNTAIEERSRKLCAASGRLPRF